MLCGEGKHASGKEQAGLLLIPTFEQLSRFGQGGFCQPEGGAVKGESWVLKWHNDERIGLAQVDEDLAVSVAFGRRKRGGLQPGPVFGDPVGAAFDELLDAWCG